VKLTEDVWHGLSLAPWGGKGDKKRLYRSHIRGARKKGPGEGDEDETVHQGHMLYKKRDKKGEKAAGKRHQKSGGKRNTANPGTTWGTVLRIGTRDIQDLGWGVKKTEEGGKLSLTALTTGGFWGRVLEQKKIAHPR